MTISGRLGRRPRREPVGIGSLTWRNSPFSFRLPSSRKAVRIMAACLVLLALLPPIFFHFRLRRFHQMQFRKCAWLHDPPLVCAHGGDSTNAFPNTMDSYRRAIHSHVDCIEIDVSRSSDGILFALHDRELQQISGNHSSRVGYLTEQQALLIQEVYKVIDMTNVKDTISTATRFRLHHVTIKELDASHVSSHETEGTFIPSVEDALRVILDAKVGPPSYEKGLAKDILSIIEKSNCKNCIVWAKSDSLVRDVIKLSANTIVGYIVLVDPSTGVRSNLLRIREARVVGVYHPLIDEKLSRILSRRNKRVYAWTVDDMQSMQRMLHERVAAVVTGNPALLKGLMQDLRTQCIEEGFSLTR